MSNVIVLGSQWGDEGKGKLVDLLADKAKVTVRFQGGNNAGHTVMFEDKTFILHLIPSGILQDGTLCVLGNGMVIDPWAMLEELEQLKDLGIDFKGRLFISDQANIIMPYHRQLDAAREARAAGKKIGTTCRGIGPAYEDKAARNGVRFAEVERSNTFKDRLNWIVKDKNRYLKFVLENDEISFDPHETYEQLIEVYGKLQEFVCDTSLFLSKEIEKGSHILFEGAQGTFLDIDHGTYPYVTSSNTTAGGACTGTGVPPTKIDRVVGVVKAYTTRVGEGPFPTELLDEIGERIQTTGGEFGATTGRPRRCGWFDACLVKEAVRLNGLTDLGITKLDVLDGLETIKICTGYKNGKGEPIESMPHAMNKLEEISPVYEEIAGWSEPSAGVTDYDNLPSGAKAYLARLSEILGVPVSIVSTGPKREETIWLNRIFE